MSSNVGKINLCSLIEKYKPGILIPEIQRDYVMGAGGKGKHEKDKLVSLLESINECAKNNMDFDFSCIISYCDEKKDNSKLEIYDGQQRLTTLLFLYLYKCKKENEKLRINGSWLEFAGRPIANEIFSKLVKDDLEIKNICISDFTSFSIKNLLSTISDNSYDYITSDFLLKRVKFDMVSIGSQNEIEQFFMDLNSGLQLKEFEIYKAKLNNQVTRIKEDWERFGSSHTYEECVNNWSYKLDNEWLNFFTPFSSFEHTEEEYEIAFIKYCFQMLAIEHQGITTSIIDIADDNLKVVNIDTLNTVYHIMNNVVKLSFYYGDTYYKLSGVLNYSWGDDEKEKDGSIGKNNYDKRGAYWSLENNGYESMFYHVIDNVLLATEYQRDLYKDILLWYFITTLDWKIDYQMEYLRIIKILLNHNVFINSKAWYECQGKGQHLYYCKYIVYGIPQYYGKHRKFENQYTEQEKECAGNLNDILTLHKYIRTQSKKEQYDLNRQHIIRKLVDINIILMQEYTINQKIIDIFTTMKKILDSSDKEYLDKIILFENKVNGIVKLFDLGNIDSIDVDKIKNDYYETKVAIEWPKRGGKSSFPSSVTVLIKCLYDKFFEEKINNDASRIITAFNNNSKMSININEDIKKMFWTKADSGVTKIYKLRDRATETSTTYNIYGSDAGWADIYTLS